MRRCVLLGALALIAVPAVPAVAQMEFEDPLGRFVVTLPEGFELFQEHGDQLFQFKRDAFRIVLLVQDGVADPATAFRKAAENFTGEAAPPPPEGAVYEVVMNGNVARQASYPFEGSSGGKAFDGHMFLGAVTLEGADMSVAYMSILNAKVVEDVEPEIAAAFHSIRMPGTSVLGAGEPVPVTDALAAAPPPDVPASTFEHNLVTLDIPAGWTATAGDGYNIAEIDREGVPTIRVIGAKKNDFGKSRKEILEALVSGMQSSMPTAKQVTPPREEATVGGDVVLIAEYEGAVVADGREVPQWILIAAFKDKNRGVGYMWFVPPDERDAVLEDVLSIVRSTR